MIPAQRQQAIITILEQQGIVGIAELTDSFGVSHMTIRRDIQYLAEKGQVVLISGGVRLAESLETEPPRKVKTALQFTEKALIAREAALNVAQGTTVYLDAGTTCLAIATQLAQRDDITVLTNDFAIASYLIESSQCELYHTGGRVVRENESCAGESAARFIAGVNIDISFISAPSWDMQYISTPMESKVPVKQAAVAASARNILVSDSSKYGKVGFFKAVPLRDLDAVITDNGLDPLVRKALTTMGLDVVIAS